jgi:hypothetical protein
MMLKLKIRDALAGAMIFAAAIAFVIWQFGEHGVSEVFISQRLLNAALLAEVGAWTFVGLIAGFRFHWEATAIASVCGIPGALLFGLGAGALAMIVSDKPFSFEAALVLPGYIVGAVVYLAILIGHHQRLRSRAGH